MQTALPKRSLHLGDSHISHGEYEVLDQPWTETWSTVHTVLPSAPPAMRVATPRLSTSAAPCLIESRTCGGCTISARTRVAGFFPCSVSAVCELALRDGDAKTDVHLHGAIHRY